MQSKLQQENDHFMSDNELLQHDLEEASETVRRLRQENDEVQDTANNDLETYTRKIRTLEGNVQKLHEDLSASKRKFLTEEEQFRSSKQRLQEQLDATQAELAKTKKALVAQETGSNTVDELRRKYQKEKDHAEKLELELSAVMGRLTAVESQLSEERQRFIAQVSRSPAHVRALSRTKSDRVRSISSSRNAATGEVSQKRSRTETARVVGTSCLSSDVVQVLEKLPGVVYAECPSNMPVPSNLTHLVTNGALTVKLLSALVRGCWVLPESFVKDSAAQNAWLSESDYGFQHEEPPLLKKKVYMTSDFQSHKNHTTTALLLREGGAVVVNDAQAADMVLCTSEELGKYPNGITWLTFTELINPVPIK
ncbi:hypothetical protein STCU_11353 [Strigomonas culicis]|uniref:BRCT domain-containing protein n=1 Tax=Strigomonas culicis TaxID=28005 RepID=S9UNV4_9TRYP|nr:hypothetical protein STCU_11353 [Strigomonas culicis]|eukprot:EPY16366.1 hypothetical protein STCU_11353 [Strigomonas culicis]